MTILKKLCIGSLLAAMCFLLVSCKKAETGMQAASDSMQALAQDVNYQYYLFISYDETADTLSIGMSSLMDLDVLFDKLDKSVKGADLGTLVFDILDVAPSEDFLTKFSTRLGSLPCKSLHCLAFKDRIVLKNEAWTALLDRTDILYQPHLAGMTNYSETGRSHLANVKKLWLLGIGADSLEDVSVLSGVEEITLTAGLFADDQEKTREELERVRKVDSQATSIYESDIYSGIGYFRSVKDLPNLKRVLFYPELESWTPDSQYYLQLFSLQTYRPDVDINPPGSSWSGDETALVPAGSIDVLAQGGDIKLVAAAYDYCLREKASECFTQGKSFKEAAGSPTIKGSCLVYMAGPTTFDSTGHPLDDFYRNGFQILHDDSFPSPASPGDTISTFVYVYPEYAYYGKYTDGTKAYETMTMVQIYDMEQQIRYPAVFVADTDPSETIYTDGSGQGSLRAAMDAEAVLDYLKTLQ